MVMADFGTEVFSIFQVADQARTEVDFIVDFAIS